MQAPIPTEHHVDSLAAETLQQLKRESLSGPISRLRCLLTQLEVLHAQEGILNIVRLQQRGLDESWQTGPEHHNAALNNTLWLTVRAQENGLIEEIKQAAQQLGGPPNNPKFECTKLPSSVEQKLRVKADFDHVRQLCLIYPEGLSEAKDDYAPLAGWYDRLIALVPADIEVVVLVKTRLIAARLQTLHPTQHVRFVVNSDLKGIWLRDYAGFSTGASLIKPIYKPKVYWGDYPTVKHISDSMRIVHSVLNLDLLPLDLVWDGGNFVTNGHYGFISNRLLQDNAKRYSQEDIEELICQHLGVEAVWVVLPESDTLAHTDGYLAFVSPTRALVGTYPTEWALNHPEDQQCVDTLALQLEKLELEVIRVPEFPDASADGKHVASAVGTYVNMLQLNETWIVPSYDVEGNEEAYRVLQGLHPNVVSIDCTELAKFGGVLHCISFCN